MKKRIIVVDDERGAGTLLKLVLPEYEVQVERDCCAALLAALDRPPDLFLLDILMPGMTGEQFAERMAQSPRLQHIPAIFISASVMTGADGHPSTISGHPAFGKPFDLAILKQTIAEELAGTGAARRAETPVSAM
jgi:CheY-like chemotaxis protein